MLLEAGDDSVLPNIQNGEDAGGPALLGEEGKAVLDGLPAVAVLTGLAAQGDSASLAGGDAEDILQRLGPAAAVQAGQTQDFAPAGGEGDVLQEGILGCQILDLQIDLAGLVGLGRELVAQLTADHQADDILHLQLGGGTGGNPGAVAHDGDFIGDALDFGHLMGDIDDGHAPGPEHIDDFEEVLHFLFRQGGGGLVEDDDLGVIGDSLGDLHHLPLGHGHGAHDPVGIYLNAQLVEHLDGVLVHLALVDHQAAHLGIAAQPQVVHDRALQSLIQLLVHHGHTVFQGFLTAFEIDLLAVQEDLPAVLGVDAEEALHQRGFARAVLAHQRMDRAPFHCQRDMIQGFDAGEGFRDVLHLQQDILLHIFLSSFSKKAAAAHAAAAPKFCLASAGSDYSPV